MVQYSAYSRRDKDVMIYSERFKKILENMSDNMVARHLLNIEDNDSYLFEVGYVDIDEKMPDMVTYVYYKNITQLENQWTKKGRISGSLDFFVDRLYNNSIRQNLVDDFVSRYKEEYNKLFKKEEKKGNSDEKLIQMLIADTKQNKLVWFADKITNSVEEYYIKKQIDKNKYLLVELTIPLVDQEHGRVKNPFLYISLMKGSKTIRYIKSVMNNGYCQDLAHIVRWKRQIEEHG